MTEPTETPPAAPAPGFSLDDEMQRLALQLHDARLRAQGLAMALEDAWRAHLAARRTAEKAGLLRPLVP